MGHCSTRQVGSGAGVPGSFRLNTDTDNTGGRATSSTLRRGIAEARYCDDSVSDRVTSHTSGRVPQGSVARGAPMAL